VRAKKSLGQHFLTDPRILGRIADALGPLAGESVLEIGPGRGALTEALLARGASLTAIEKDRDLVPVLQSRFPSLTVVEGDALEVDWHAVAPGALICGNIPYNVTSPLIDRALQPPRARCVVFLVQKEVAERVVAPPGGEIYGALSVGVQAVARAERLFNVGAGAFSPPPRVASSVLRLVPLDAPHIADQDVPRFRRLVVGCFCYRRKQIGRGLRELLGWEAPRVLAALGRAGIAADDRPETLAPADFARMLAALVDDGWAEV
jgi:16S rRNA (adenine1518-N6/adenine1519-N6)-dimethyltransferase